MIYLLIWLLIGSVSLNLLWMSKYISKSEEREYATVACLRGLVLGLLAGPAVWVVYLFTKEGDR